jgi:hypothetical protein
MTAKLSRQSVIFLDMVAFPDCEKHIALDWAEHSKDRGVGRAFVALRALTRSFRERYSRRS